MKSSVLLIEHLIVLFNIVATFSQLMRDNGRIINGIDAHIGQFPYVVSLEVIAKGDSEFCGGSLIAPTWVLTAAHCFDSIDTVLVFLGSTLSDNAVAGYNILPNNVIRYPLYVQSSLAHDIALVRVPETEQCSLISTIALPPVYPHDLPSYVGKNGLIIGWGAIQTGAPISDRLKWGVMRITNQEVCWTVDPAIYIEKLCAAVVTGASACHGDSGGPFVVDSVLIGVISYRASHGPYCEDGEPIILNRVDYYMDWIKHITGIQ